MQTMPSGARARVASSNSLGSSLMMATSFSREPLRTTEVFGSFGRRAAAGHERQIIRLDDVRRSCRLRREPAGRPFAVGSLAPGLLVHPPAAGSDRRKTGAAGKGRQQQGASRWLYARNRRVGVIDRVD